MIIDKLKKLLDSALTNTGQERILAIKEFQEIVWDDISIKDEQINDMLTDIAYILDFYEPDEKLRKEDLSYYGDEQLDNELQKAIQKLQSYQ